MRIAIAALPCWHRMRLPPRAAWAKPFAWLAAERPVAIVGSSIRVYHLAASAPAR